jgi:Phosphoenolpyruvate synthase/pyruvate phosphate dikinase
MKLRTLLVYECCAFYLFIFLHYTYLCINHFLSSSHRLQSLWEASRLEDDFKVTLASHLDENKIYAVRSSGIDEDLGSTSAAGQNDTVLGVSGCKSVGDSIVLCWSSLFSYHAVQYRR